MAPKNFYPKGGYIFREGESADYAYILKEGSVEIVKTAADGDMVLVTLSEPNTIFGEMALIDDSARMATARAVGGATEALVVSRRIFEEKLESADPFLRALITILAKRVRPMVGK